MKEEVKGSKDQKGIKRTQSQTGLATLTVRYTSTSWKRSKDLETDMKIKNGTLFSAQSLYADFSGIILNGTQRQAGDTVEDKEDYVAAVRIS